MSRTEWKLVIIWWALMGMVALGAQRVVGPEIRGELRDGMESLPVGVTKVCLVKSRPPEDLVGVIDCLDEDEREFCIDTTTTVHDDKLDWQGLMEKYEGSYYGDCEEEER